MTPFETAAKFFEACETSQGWDGCKEFAAENATFSSHCEPLEGIDTAEGYCEWMKGLGTQIAPDCSYDLHSSAYDETNNTALFFATFHGTHTLDGGPVPPTNKETHVHYVYALTMNAEGKVEKFVKIWNAGWTLKEFGWA